MESLYCEFTGRGANFQEKHATLECATLESHIEYHPRFDSILGTVITLSV